MRSKTPLPMARRPTLCGQRRASAERAIAGPGKKPDQGAQQPRAHGAASDATQHTAQRCLRARHRHLAPLPPPRRRRWEALAPPPPPSPQRLHRDPPLAPDRLQACPAGQHQRVHHHKQRRHTESAPEEARRRRLHTTPAIGAAQTEPPGVVSKLRRQTVRLARVGGAVQHCAAVRASARAAPLRLGRVNPRQEGPDTGVGEGRWRRWSERTDCATLVTVSVDLTVTETSPSESFLQDLRGAPASAHHPVRAGSPQFPSYKPRALSLPRFTAGSASASPVSRPAQRSLSLRPAWSLSHPR